MRKIETVLLTIGQIVVLGLIWVIADRLVNYLHLPIPANLTGMLLLLTLVFSKIVNVEWLRRGAAWLLAEMLLFFVPAVVAVVNYQPLVREQGGRIILVLVLSTVLVIAVTAWVVDKLYRLELTLARRKSNKLSGAL
ncbi:CidA/LrgA family protein [Vibrio metschnikovii]|uniref:CidA/LrgA family protein n=2 Tax=Unclassified Bacteria TaxID=49928 RepID=A0AAU6UST7_UNCXX|nr:CidA/LrgA family protein [Vibrio metschnikovii]EKO3598189.1 CidA/LrgA family protein [Vibrio metschnikovii]EKO3620353.1 CidA/LrgA family protein [Vibrio metschnikovii]EKO3623568.1 CidA/LrgA family protein [Vibrio metschnikovii]EKO3630140.1 CidA/LrgA family protein [Vibrio metschnikovii]